MEFRVLRAVFGLSQRDLADVLELDHRRISELELGQRGLTPDQAERFIRCIVARLVPPGTSPGPGGTQDRRDRRR